jgi:hypothetical protein
MGLLVWVGTRKFGNIFMGGIAGIIMLGIPLRNDCWLPFIAVGATGGMLKDA